MRCTSPLSVGFNADGRTLCWSPTKYSKQYAPIQLPCGKCIACRLERSRQTAVRCVHEAQLHENNAFITLTYSDKYLKSDKLIYDDFQKFMKRLRKYRYESFSGPLETKEQYDQIKISCLVTGEYGDRSKRPHWHALLFNWDWPDKETVGQSDLGDKIFTSPLLSQLWPMGRTESGSVTFRSASYVARYALKKLYHGADGSHRYEPISKRSVRPAIGKRWIERYWRDVFSYGYIVLPDGSQCGIPRYYETWFKNNKPQEWEHYVTHVKSKIISDAIAKEAAITIEEKKNNLLRDAFHGLEIKRSEIKKILLEKRLNESRQYLKL